MGMPSNWSLVCLAWSFWMWFVMLGIADHARHGCNEEEDTCFQNTDGLPLVIPVGACAGVWLIAVLFLEIDARIFAAKALVRLWFPLSLSWFIICTSSSQIPIEHVKYPLIVNSSLILFLIALGPGRIARIRVIGPPLVRYILSSQCQRHASPSAAVDEARRGTKDVEKQVI
eukprot:TRINITY_DN4238_c0_g1_i1.p1 TRINITY_DN4238_c0_g1~~TRINITY_DN4238_c0_g1_i1.p1  ORF type:complete len:172 (+),score=11.25 TRINITY_DN4238_c0_g1_i1:79-594(+)